MEKRSLFNELMSGVENMQALREGKITLRSIRVEELAPPLMSGQDMIALRARLHVSRAVFARYLRVKPRTLEGWEQGRSKPNAQAAVLLKLVERRPELLEEIAAI